MKIVIAVTGASGSIYAKRLIEYLVKDHELIVLASHYGKQTFEHELEQSIEDFLKPFHSKIEYFKVDNMFASIASGSYHVDAVVVVPCSMSTIASINAGVTHNLIIRCCDVAIKEQRPLILVCRETPLSTLHLKNMYELSSYGVKILPASPGFYQKPSCFDELVDFVVGKILDALKIENDLYEHWR